MSTLSNVDADESALLGQYALLVQAALNGDQQEAVTEGVKAVRGKTRDPELSCKCASLMSTIYSAQKDWDIALDWARTAVNEAETSGNAELSWTAAIALTMIWRDWLINTKACSTSDFENFDSFVTSWVEKTGESQRVGNQIEMLGMMAQIRGVKMQRIDGLEKELSARESLLCIEKANDLLSFLPEGREQLAALADIQFRTASFYCGADEYANAIACLELAQSLFTKLDMRRQATKAQTKKAQIRQLWIYQSYLDRGMSPAEVESLLINTMEDLENVDKNLLESGMRFQMVNCKYLKALLWEHAHLLGQAEALQYALEELEQAEGLLNSIRSDMTLQKDEEMRRHKTALVARSANIHETAVSLSLQAEQINGAWQWVQRGKARAFLDLLSLEESIPLSFLDAARVHEEARNLLDEEVRLMRECESAHLEERFPIRQKLVACREKMSTVAELDDIRLFRGMATLTGKHLTAMFPSHERVVCVDWVLVKDSIYMFTIRPGNEPEVAQLSISVGEVSLWIQSNLKAEYLRQPRANERLRELDALISPLSSKSEPADLLVFCPAGLLSGLPLHALQIHDELLLERNPVIYIPSLAVLYHCVFRRSEVTVHLKSASIFGNPSCDRPKAQESADSLARALGVTPYMGPKATKEAFLRATQDPGLALFHGHAAFDASDPLQSALILNKGDNHDSTSKYLTAREILQVRLQSVLFILIACESAKQEFEAGEEPSGLLPMLMLAGVNSVIGTLWKCSDIAGKEFAEALFRALPQDAAMQGRVLFDCAAAVQQAALAVRKTRQTPYFWAPFILSGDWKCWISCA